MTPSPERLATEKTDRTAHQWILSDTAYVDWIAQNKSSDKLRLWISGASKTGKTSLAVHIVDHLQNFASTGTKNTQVLSFFCLRQYQNRDNASAVLKGWLCQLIRQRPDLTQEVSLWLQQEKTHFDDANVLWHMFRRALQSPNAGTTYCILDGLQECKEGCQVTLTRFFAEPFPLELGLQSEPALKILITSRSPTGMKTVQKIDLDTKVGSKLGSKVTLRAHLHGLSEEDKQTCIETLGVLAAQRFPPTSNWLMMYFRVNEGNIQWRLELCKPIIPTCDGLVRFDDTDARQVFASRSDTPAIHGKLTRLCLAVIRRELSLISMEDLEGDTAVWWPHLSLNLKYAIEYWGEHARLASDPSQGLLEDIMTTFTRNSTTLEKWWILYLELRYSISQEFTCRQHHTTPVHLLALFGLDKLLHTARLKSRWWPLLERYWVTNDCMMMGPFRVGIVQRHQKVVEFFLEEKAVVGIHHCISAAGSTVEILRLVVAGYARTGGSIGPNGIREMLSKAVLSGDKQIVSDTVNFVVRYGEGKFPLDNFEHLKHIIDASQHHVLEPLLSRITSASTVARLIDYAAENHHPILFTKLISMDKIRNIIMAQKITMINALNHALERKSPEMVNLLMTEINVHLKDKQGRTPLQVAARFAHVLTMQHFLAKKTFRFDRGTIEEGLALNLFLHDAGTHGRMVNLEEILQKGVRMRYEHFGMTALHVGVELGSIAVVDTLFRFLPRGEMEADINRKCTHVHAEQGREGMTALAIAAAKGYHQIVWVLLFMGAKSGCRDKTGRTALDLAALAGHFDVVALLSVQKLEDDDESEEKEGGESGVAEGDGGMGKSDDDEGVQERDAEAKGEGEGKKKHKGKRGGKKNKK
ncbi:hypothetical protein BDW02DRAFT_574635 [Decorospora gaudefroyi]|uniref:Nephrocystin 3-like N-terminal domain-containing protein n=1 Tax=Decorospora gaudefroyi TaxID=184978 RepID=A0A6A5K5K7_9PLEO|nr:hypothetical protein BDW02DRAFT_574635 [Decorospora gaudefroyi]